MRQKIYVFASISMAIAIMLGALGAHKLEESLSSGQLDSFKTGVFYQIIHALALLALAPVISQIKSKKINVARYCLQYGPLLFSGSIYLLATSPVTGLHISNILGPITPIGGVIMITGWILLGVTLYNTRFKTNE